MTRREKALRDAFYCCGQSVCHAEPRERCWSADSEKGQGTNREVLDAETLRTLSHSNHFNAVDDAVLAAYRLRRAVGTL